MRVIRLWGALERAERYHSRTGGWAAVRRRQCAADLPDRRIRADAGGAAASKAACRRPPLLKQRQSARPRGGLGAILHAELAQDIADVALDGQRRDRQRAGNLGV